ncbi:RcpC/CpaB family pilus assembly protein [Streptomyces sp. 061-3]|uniref:RcpC/CpaB family pilus assembly protein n=1 Tax=Streptomyces sp. 061-3 TaxID=2789268 RepID=UPI00398106D5
MFPPVSPTTSSSDVRPTVPGPPVSAPPPCGVPAFAPLRVRGGGGRRLRRTVWRQRRAMAAGLALTAAALAATGLTGGDGGSGATDRAGGSAPEGERRPVQLVSAPVRIADAATVRLLRPGDRVDVIAGEGSGADARVVAKGARVTAVPRTAADGAAEDSAEGGALVVLSVPRSTAASLAGAGISARLAVTLC